MGLLQKEFRLPISIIEIISEYQRIQELMEEHGHDLGLYEELHGSLTTLKWLLGLHSGPPSDYYFDSANEEEKFKEGK